ncbi:AraC family transcriptional regulator [Paenibacillus thermotolerans]|uniref:AraC family transcriptional regulator n=1 Tax=Paenibacillus thermotolerans TaxID=3027807 RepID=UPI00236752C9|nr:MULTISPECIES: AraC family transcriptional regulator [unclassified Paenibacillus]
METQDIEVLSAGYSYHTRPFHSSARDGLQQYLFRLQSEGSCFALIDGKMTLIETGDLMLFKPTDTYELLIEPAAGESADQSKTSSGDYFLFCRGSWLDRWWSRNKPPQRLKVPLHSHWLPQFRSIVAERRNNDVIGASITEHLMKALCLNIERFLSLYGASPSEGRSFLALRMRTFIEEHALSSFSVSDVARHAGLSVSRTVHLYKEIFGKSIMQHAMDVRLEVAAERMLYTPLTLEQVAETTGFGSYSYFHRCFKDKFGCSPREFRNSRREAKSDSLRS